MTCCHPTRRQVLRLASASAAMTGLLPFLERDRAQAAGVVVPMNLELVTLTETSFVVTWYTAQPSIDGTRLAPMPSDTVLMLGTSPTNLRTVIDRPDATPYHYAEVTGLEPGQTYYYAALSGGVPAVPSVFASGNVVGTSVLDRANLSGPFVVTTPQPPPGEHLFSVALANDVHMGETVAGLIATEPVVGGIPPGFSQVPGEPPYPLVMAQAMVADARARGADALLVAGDVTAEAAVVDVAHAHETLGAFGVYERDWHVTRGNHDRVHTGKPDTFKAGFFADEHTWFSRDLFGMRVIGLDTYDKVGNGGDNGMLSAAQESWFDAELAKDRDVPTLVFGHHPITLESTLVNVNAVRFDLQPQQALRVEQQYAKTPGVFLHHAGHTHRTKRTVGTTATDVVFQEVSSTKEYPGGFTMLRVFTGGYALNYYKTRSDLAREWSERTRQEDFTAYPYYVLGTTSDRNHVVKRDLSGLRKPSTPATSTSMTSTPPRRHRGAGGGAPAVSEPGGALAATGLPAAAALAAGGLAAAGALLTRCSGSGR
ncbi:MAG TPA: metallophosphoesterase [Mycobacteriales bacterium]|nr:metallophosphoesterase [Mycobacteriales bacterium]